MSRTISAVVMGCGEMGLLITRLMVERGIEIRGAVARSSNKVGRDVGELAGIGSLGVAVSDQPGAVLARARPDISIVATTSPLSTIRELVVISLEAGCDVLTLEEQSFYPWLVEAARSRELDLLARERGVTILGTGLQDVFWGVLPASLMASSHNIQRVVGRSTWNTDDFGSGALHDDPIVGKPPAVIHDLDANGAWDRPTVPPVLHALAALSNLTPGNHRARVRPIIATQDTPSVRHRAVVRTGSLLGFAETVTLETTEGPVLEFEMAGYLHAPGEHSVNEWHVYGEPYVESVDSRFDARLGTALGLVNRIPDVIAAQPGFATVDSLPMPRYRHGPLEHPVGSASGIAPNARP